MILYTPGNVFANMIVIFKSLILQKFIHRIADESFAKNYGAIFRHMFNTVRPGKILFFPALSDLITLCPAFRRRSKQYNVIFLRY